MKEGGNTQRSPSFRPNKVERRRRKKGREKARQVGKGGREGGGEAGCAVGEGRREDWVERG